MKYEDRIGKLYWYPALYHGGESVPPFLFMITGVVKGVMGVDRYKAESFGVSEKHWSKPSIFFVAVGFNYLEAVPE